MSVIKLFPEFSDTTPACFGDCHQGDLPCPSPDACLISLGDPVEEYKLVSCGSWAWFFVATGAVVAFIWVIGK